MPPAPDGELHTSKAIQGWIKETKDVVNDEGIEWITSAAEVIVLDASTQVHSFDDPDRPSTLHIELDGTDKMNITDVNIQNKLVCIFNEYGSAALHYNVLKAGAWWLMGQSFYHILNSPAPNER